MNACLSEFALDDLVLRGETSSAGTAHVGSCAACQRRRDERHALLADLGGLKAGPLLREVLRRHEVQRRRRWRMALALPAALALACSLVLVLVRRETPLSDVYLGAKGAASVVVHCRRGGRTFPLASRDQVQAADELRFVPRPSFPAARYVVLASIDGTGRYTPFYPAEPGRESVPLPPPGEPLAGSIRLDAAQGPERIFFVFSTDPLPGSAVKQAAEAQLPGLGAVNTVAGARVESGWVVLSKRTLERGGP